MTTKTIYYWKLGAWVDDQESAELAVDCLGFPVPEMVELDIDSNVDSEIAGLIPQPEII